MSVVFKIGDKYPETCDECPLFVDGELGVQPFCIGEGGYTEEELYAEKDGNLNMYYHGCLATRPKNCPLVEVKDE